MLALKTDKGFTNAVSSGEECGIILDSTNFYAEQGGQEWDEGQLNSVVSEVRSFIMLELMHIFVINL